MFQDRLWCFDVQPRETPIIDYDLFAPVYDTYGDEIVNVVEEIDYETLVPIFDTYDEPVEDVFVESFVKDLVALAPEFYVEFAFQVVSGDCVVPCCFPKLMLESRTTRILEGENDTSRAITFDPFREPFKEEVVVVLCSSSRRPVPKPPWPATTPLRLAELS